MILSVSRRTDIPAFFSDWFFRRLEAGFVCVRNPVRPHQISKICLSPEVVDGIVFWTKNPIPMLNKLWILEAYPWYFQFTLTAYGKDVEPGLPSKENVLIPAFQDLSRLAGRERVIWRYDPILITDAYTIEYHCKYFESLAKKLKGFTEKCTVSFVDYYQNTENNLYSLHPIRETTEQRRELLRKFSDIASANNITVDICAERENYAEIGIPAARCIDQKRLEQIGGRMLSVKKDSKQRRECGCVESIDLGAYHTCPAGCRYCYAVHSQKQLRENLKRYDPDSSLLCGYVSKNDIVRERKMRSYEDMQLRLWDFISSSGK